MRNDIDDLLRNSVPAERISDPQVQARLSALVAGTRREAKRSRAPLVWLAVPALALPAIALATTGSTETRLVPDYIVPISYVTDTGKAVDCSIEFFNQEIDYVETGSKPVDWLRAQDWDNIGQRLYETALEFEPGAESELHAWNLATDELIYDAVLASAFTSTDRGFGSDSDCTGELH